MLQTIRALRVASALSLAALLPLAQAQSAQALVRMNANKVSITSLASPSLAVERILFSGEATVNSRLAKVADFGNSTLIMLIDMSGVVGVGAKSGTRYVLSSREYIVRPHAANQTIEFTFPMTTDENAPIGAVRSGSARFVLNVDLDTGIVTSLAASLTPR